MLSVIEEKKKKFRDDPDELIGPNCRIVECLEFFGPTVFPFVTSNKSAY